MGKEKGPQCRVTVPQARGQRGAAPEREGHPEGGTQTGAASPSYKTSLCGPHADGALPRPRASHSTCWLGRALLVLGPPAPRAQLWQAPRPRRALATTRNAAASSRIPSTACIQQRGDT